MQAEAEVARLTEERDSEHERAEVAVMQSGELVLAIGDKLEVVEEERDQQREDIRRLVGLIECRFKIKPCSVALKGFRGSWCRNCHAVAELKEKYGA